MWAPDLETWTEHPSVAMVPQIFLLEKMSDYFLSGLFHFWDKRHAQVVTFKPSVVKEQCWSCKHAAIMIVVSVFYPYTTAYTVHILMQAGIPNIQWIPTLAVAKPQWLVYIERRFLMEWWNFSLHLHCTQSYSFSYLNEKKKALLLHQLNTMKSDHQGKHWCNFQFIYPKKWTFFFLPCYSPTCTSIIQTSWDHANFGNNWEFE